MVSLAFFARCLYVQGTLNDGYWKCPLTVASWNTNSVFSFFQIAVYDKTGNALIANCSDSLSPCYKTLTISTPIDSNPPVLRGYRLFNHATLFPVTIKNFVCLYF